MEISPAMLTLLTTGSALLGVLITSFFNMRTTRITKESEERKHQKELVINAAIENWKQQLEGRQRGQLLLTLLSPLRVHGLLTYSSVHL